MINNLEADGVQVKIDTETGSNPIVKAIYDHIASKEGGYGVVPEVSGLEFSSTTEVMGFPNRSRVKVFEPESDKLMAWFYKPSAVQFSRDRYSLGGVVWELSKVDQANIGSEIDQWLTWLDSGLSPDSRPDAWKSAVPYDIPL